VEPLKIVIGSDDAGFQYKEAIKEIFEADEYVTEVIDVGVDAEGNTPYPTIAVTAAEMVAEGKADRGLLICGTGMGVAMSANKVPGIRASTAHDSYSVERLVLSNNAQILTFGQRVIGLELAKKLATEWLRYRFDETSASAEKVAVLTEYENRNAR